MAKRKRQTWRGRCVTSTLILSFLCVASVTGQFGPRNELPDGPDSSIWHPPELIEILGSERGHHWWEAYAVSFSPDGNWIVSGGGDENLFVWDARTLAPMAFVLGLSDTVQSIAIHPGGGSIAAGLANGQVRIFDYRNGQLTEAHRLTGHSGRVTDLRYARNGSTLIVGGRSNTHFYDVTGKHPLETVVLAGTGGWSLDVSGDGRTLVVAGDGRLSIWSLTGAKPQLIVQEEIKALSVAVSPDGRKVATGGFYSNETLTIWQIGEDKLLELSAWQPGSNGGIRALRFSDDGKWLASSTGYNNDLHVWNVEDLAAVPKTLSGHASKTFDLVFSPDGKLLASASSDHSVRLWELAGEPRPTEASKSANQLPVRLHSIFYSKGQALMGLAWTRAGTHPQVAQVAVDLRSGRSVTLPAPTAKPAGNMQSYELVETLMSPAGDLVARRYHVDQNVDSETEGFVEISSLLPRTPPKSVVIDESVSAMVWSADGQHLVTGSIAGSLQRWEARSGKLTNEIPVQGTTKALRFAAGNEIIAVQDSSPQERSVRPQVVVWDITGQHIKTLIVNQPEKVDEVCIAANAKRFALRQRHGPVFIFDLEGKTLSKVSEIHCHGQYFMDEFSRDGSLLGMHTWGAPFQRLGLFDPNSGKPVKEWQMPGDTYGSCFSPDGRTIAVSNLNGTIAVLRVPTPPDVQPMPSTFDPNVVSGSALAAGFFRENVTSRHRWLAPFRSK